MATVTVNTLEFVSALRALIPISKQATLYSGEKERNAATIAARITPAKKLALITGNSALGAIASVGIEQAAEAAARAANKVWNPKEHLAAGPTAHENI